MSEEITYAKVVARVTSAAEEIIAANAPFPKEGSLEAWQEYSDNLKACLDEARDHARQEVDAWDWTAYMYQGFQVYEALPFVERTDAEEEYFKCNGNLEIKTLYGPYDMAAGMAWFALVSMLTQKIEKQCEDLQELAQDKIWQLERV